MNIARLPQPNEVQDEHRPKTEHWGPVRFSDAQGVLRDAVDAAAIPDDVERPVKCDICNAHAFESLGIIYGYPLYRCTACDVGFVWPQPSDSLLAEYYGPGYWSTYMQDTRTLYERQPLCDLIFRRQAQCFDRLVKHDREIRILDVGAGDGTMLRLLKDLGYSHAQGLDLDATNCQRARERLGVHVEQQDFLQYQESGWDAITLWAVIEHLKSPASYVEHARRLLKPGGLFILMTGDNNSASAKVQGCFDMWLYPPEHLYFFGKQSLSQLLKRNQFQKVCVQVGYQNRVKESLLTVKRWMDSALRMLKTRTRPHWRSTASNLLVAWGRKSTDQAEGPVT